MITYRRSAPLYSNTTWDKGFRALEHSTTAMRAVELCSRLALSPATAKRDALLDRLEQMSPDEMDELAYAAELS